jgi:hypothetical protein
MKIFPKIKLSLVLIQIVFSFSIYAQTFVKGGIYANTTWVRANSPYIILDTIVVFPNVTLTIQSGVVVKFENNKYIEIRQGSLVAIGTSKDSITFTSNASVPYNGIYGGIYINGGSLPSKLNYCVFKYANEAIYSATSGSIILKNSTFTSNIKGFKSVSGIALIDSCYYYQHSNTGIHLENLSSYNINYCTFVLNNKGAFCINSKYQGGSLSNSKFYLNKYGLNSSFLKVNKCTFIKNGMGIAAYTGLNRIINCIIDSNSVVGIGSNYDSIIGCQIKHNDIGINGRGSVIIENSIENNRINIYGCCDKIIGNTIRNGNIGITGSSEIKGNLIEGNVIGIDQLFELNGIQCNKIFNNKSYNLVYADNHYRTFYDTNNWGTSDSASIRASIYDGYHDKSLGFIYLVKSDSSKCNLLTVIPDVKPLDFSFSIFPNPVSNYLELTLPSEISKVEIKIFNCLGFLEYSSASESQKTTIDLSSLSTGMHIFQIKNANNFGRLKFIKL